MKNLAGNKSCDDQIRRELTRVGIEMMDLKSPLQMEVPQSVIGRLEMTPLGETLTSEKVITIRRGWNYWIVRGRVPLTVANLLYADPVGRTDIRVSGHCACPAPKDWAEYFLVDGRKVISQKEWDEANNSTGMLREILDAQKFFTQYVPHDDPTSIGAVGVIDTYHIDSELGLYIFVKILREQRIVK